MPMTNTALPLIKRTAPSGPRQNINVVRAQTIRSPTALFGGTFQSSTKISLNA